MLDLSVLIATRNRARLLESTLDHLREQELGGIRWEVIVVDNGSEDATQSVLATAGRHLPLVALDEPLAGKNRALNRALEVARGELLVFTDDDVVPEKRWLAELLAAARRWPDCSILAGRIIPALPPSTPAWLRDHPFGVNAFGLFSPPQGEGPLTRLPFGSNFAVRTRAVAGVHLCEEIGPRGNNYAMGSESALLARLTAQGEQMVYVPSAMVRHVVEEHQIRIAWLLRRSFRAGRGKARLGLDDFRPVVWLFGAPRYLWRMAASSGIRFALSAFRGEPTRFEAGRKFCFVLGSL